ncbi:hypothetical protein [Bradyrhizobium lablabi]|uniref:hypothetical protein n=1 Tax=Bradyrhizobium lablabi TaxID=722472 RepID=UPI001BA6BF3B|nr:hypothetical protein [Bradyrhizobium lablabi]MBR0697557.1 hypothetical protein [Bradyrhizobium lablabi]
MENGIENNELRPEELIWPGAGTMVGAAAEFVFRLGVNAPEAHPLTIRLTAVAAQAPKPEDDPWHRVALLLA